MTNDTTVFWFRRDLRVDDNAGLYHALKNNTNVLPVFIFDSVILDALDDEFDARVTFIHEALKVVRDDLQKAGSSLLVLHGDPVEIFSQLNPRNVYTNRDYEPYALRRDELVRKSLESKGIAFHSFKDQVIFDHGEVMKSDGKPYTVFTPYSRPWRAKLKPFYYKSYPVSKYLGSLKQSEPLPFPTLEVIGFRKTKIELPPRVIRRSIIRTYDQTRDYPGKSGTSRLGIHLRFGTISIRQMVRLALKSNDTWLNELIWREFYSMILFQFPHVTEHAFKPAYDRIRWRNNEAEFTAWCEGMTGYPLVDAGMRELNETGFMHNRVRMVTASFLTKHLLIDWRWGEAFFAKKLLDYELASNNGGWQWAAGSGCDAAPYFRVFNPTLQAEKFDPKGEYVSKWVPELGTSAYPKPIVAHAAARDRALKTYSSAVQQA